MSTRHFILSEPTPARFSARKREARRGVRGNVMFPPNRCQCFQVTHLQVADLQWDATGTVFGLMPSKSALSLAPYSRPACGVITIYTNPPPAFTRSLRSAASFQRLLPSRQTPRHEMRSVGWRLRLRLFKAYIKLWKRRTPESAPSKRVSNHVNANWSCNSPPPEKSRRDELPGCFPPDHHAVSTGRCQFSLLTPASKDPRAKPKGSPAQRQEQAGASKTSYQFDG